MTTFGKTVQDHLDTSNIQHLAPALSQISFGELIAGLIPAWYTYAGLDNQAAHVLNAELDGTGDDQAAIVLQVAETGNAPLTIVPDGVGAGEAKVTYSSEGVPTIEFAAAVTGFKVCMLKLPASLATNLAVRM
jgi:hypothetical protein